MIELLPDLAPEEPERRGPKRYGPNKLPYGLWVDELRERGIWAADWLRDPGDPNVLCAVWTSRRMPPVCQIEPTWQRLDVELLAPGNRRWWAELLRRRTVVLVCRCGDKRCHREQLALLLVALGQRSELPTIYCGETH